jgi:hypothetical protein
VTTIYGYGGSHSQPSSPRNGWSSQSQSNQSQSDTSGPHRIPFSLPGPSTSVAVLRGPTPGSKVLTQAKLLLSTHSNTFTSISHGFTDTSATIRRLLKLLHWDGHAPPQTLSVDLPLPVARSPSSSVRNIIMAWKSHSPSIDKSSQVSATDTTPGRARGRGLRGASGEKELQVRWMVNLVLARSGEVVPLNDSSESHES